MNEHIDVSLDLKAIGRRVKFQREAMNLTREGLAEIIDISSKFCADIEYGTRGVSLITMAKLSQALRVSTDYLIFGSSNRFETSLTQHSVLMENILAPLYCCSDHQLIKAGEMVKIFADAIRGGYRNE